MICRILIDAVKGVVTQTRRHSYIAALLGIRQVIVAINKMDLVDYSPRVFEDIEREYRQCAARIELQDVTCIPVAAVHGHNIAVRSAEMSWYSGPTLLECLENARPRDFDLSRAFRLPIQWVNGPDSSFRGFAGMVASGRVRAGDRVKVLPSGRDTSIRRILLGHRDVEEASARQSVTITLADELDVSRGDVIAAPDRPPPMADQFEATIVWMDEQPLLQGRSYLMLLGPQAVPATVAPIKYKVNVDTLEHVAARKLELNDIGVCDIELSRPVVFEAYRATAISAASFWSIG